MPTIAAGTTGSSGGRGQERGAGFLFVRTAQVAAALGEDPDAAAVFDQPQRGPQRGRPAGLPVDRERIQARQHLPEHRQREQLFLRHVRHRARQCDPSSGGSRFEMWFAATSKPPLSGTFSPPLIAHPERGSQHDVHDGA